METSKRIAWNRNSEVLLLELVKQRKLLWDPKDPLYYKATARKEAFRSIAEELSLQYPELSQLSGDQVRIRFKILRMHLLTPLKKIRDAPSGSAGCPGVKWPLYNAAKFLLDAQGRQTPEGEDSDSDSSTSSQDSDAGSSSSKSRDVALALVIGRCLERIRLERSREPTNFADIMGQIVTAAASKLPYAKQLELIGKVMNVMAEVLTENKSGKS